MIFCDEIIKRNIFWVCEGHISNIIKYPEMLDYMVKSNLIGLQIGIESGSDKVLKAYNKHTTSADILKTVEICIFLWDITFLVYFIGVIFLYFCSGSC